MNSMPFSKENYEKFARLTLILYGFKQFFGILIWNNPRLGALVDKVFLIAYLMVFINAVIVFFSFDTKGKLLTAVVFSLLFLSFLNTRETSLLGFALMTFLFAKTDYFSMIKAFAWTRLICLGILVLFNIFNVVNSTPFYRSDASPRHAFGMGHPNTMAMYLFVLFVSFWLVYLVDRPLISSAVAGVLAVFIWRVVDSQTTTRLLLLFIPAIWAKPLFAALQRFENLLLLLPSGAVALSAFLSAYCWQICDKFGWSTFMARFTDAHNVYAQFGLTLFGSNFDEVMSMSIMDNAYMACFLIYGVVTGVMFVIALTYLIKKLIDKKQYPLLLILILFMINAFMEKLILYAASSIVLSGILNNFEPPESENKIRRT